MVEVNRAYAAGDEERLQNILQEWQRRPESVKDEGIGAELIRVIRKIAQVEDRLAAIETEIEELMETELHQLFVRVREAEDEGRDLIEGMAEEIDVEITSAKAEGYKVLVELLMKMDGRFGRNRRLK